MTLPFYAFAHNLRGFSMLCGNEIIDVTTLRVRVERMESGYAWVRTADLHDAGTPLTLDASQIEAEHPETVEMHRDSLVVFC